MTLGNHSKGSLSMGTDPCKIGGAGPNTEGCLDKVLLMPYVPLQFAAKGPLIAHCLCFRRRASGK
jgi:hypothetical protein